MKPVQAGDKILASGVGPGNRRHMTTCIVTSVFAPDERIAREFGVLGLIDTETPEGPARFEFTKFVQDQGIVTHEDGSAIDIAASLRSVS